MISTQKLVITVITMNLLIGLVGSAMTNINNYQDDVIANDIALMEDYQSQFSDDDVLYGGANSENDLTEPTIGSSLNWGRIIFDIFLKGLNPLSIHAGMFDNYLEKIVANLLLIVRNMIGLILMLDLYFIFKNRKTS